jgi:hypothetical protein
MNKMSMDEISEKFGYTNADNAKEPKVQMLTKIKDVVF